MSRLAAWLGDTVPVTEQAIVRRAMTDMGILEIPPGSNRSPVIDSYVAAVGSPTGSRWCAAAVAAWWRESGVGIPNTDAGSCTEWVTWAKARGVWSSKPLPGHAVVYGNDGIATHIGVVVRVEPLLLSVEGNTSVGGDVDTNGVAVALKQVTHSRVLGYIAPVAVQ